MGVTSSSHHVSNPGKIVRAGDGDTDRLTSRSGGSARRQAADLGCETDHEFARVSRVIHLIWSGLGFLVAVITFGCCLAAEILVESAFNDDRCAKKSSSGQAGISFQGFDAVTTLVLCASVSSMNDDDSRPGYSATASRTSLLTPTPVSSSRSGVSGRSGVEPPLRLDRVGQGLVPSRR